ncbi:low molecular weight protein arginine phosphatase [Gracilibacillus caseinilyticus]|uniref:Low molecular weight protein arginine phosphatase n=1 Tax=Gracilibacillus caseinilyticus TaxID=2932256 RepID=A0ABY4F0P5_9BACI|nr:low molecular weight protein arginine phosphatase [Gracilibacillus caseinilyticus]UOQ50243.1 low molecular weight protein arginine phosphatase [Gracilibacillus caseinilyticus]
MTNILFVCTGNTCRSPMAQAIIQHKSHINVQSAGIFAGEGAPASQGTKEVLHAKGIPFQHQSQPVTASLLEWADVVLTMTQNHRDLLKQQYQAATNKVFTLKEYIDPDYEQAWTELKEAYAQLEDQKLVGKEMQADVIRKINKLEKKVQNVDISDPFGGNIMTYQKTYEELDNYLAQLVKKMENENR